MPLRQVSFTDVRFAQLPHSSPYENQLIPSNGRTATRGKPLRDASTSDIRYQRRNLHLSRHNHLLTLYVTLSVLSPDVVG